MFTVATPALSWSARILAGWLVALTMSLQAQTPAALPNLNLLQNGEVNAMLRLGDGSVIIGGFFSSVGGVARQSLAKRRPWWSA
jgi:hypothetical protein